MNLLLRATLVVSALVWCVACESAPVFSRRPPNAEFLLAAGDSTYWIRSSPEGMRVRSAPVLLTEADGHFYEIFISDEVHDYEDASFARARVFRRDILRDDSLLVYEDQTVRLEVAAWLRRNPRAIPLDPSDDFDDEAPPTFVSDDIEVMDVHGPWLTFGHVLDVDVAGRAAHRHTRQHGVVDVRSGTRASLQVLFGTAEATRLQQQGVRSLADMRDSVRRSTDQRGAAARRTLSSFLFDSMSFGLTDINRAPAIAFLVPGTGEQGEALTLSLPALTAAPPDWWTPVVRTIPSWNADSTQLSWVGSAYEIIARPNADGDFLVIELLSRSQNGPSHSWAIATVPAPAYQLVALDELPLDSTTRSALARAFDQSTVLNGTSQQASARVRSAAPPLRVVNRRVSPAIKQNGGTSCPPGARRVCRNARPELSPLYRLPVRADAWHSDSGDRRRMAGL